MKMEVASRYEALCKTVASIELPAAFVDLDAFDNNIEQVTQTLSSNKNTKLRIATKSIRVPDLIARVLEKVKKKSSGLMCYSVKEAYHLYTEKKLNDLLIAYPTVQAGDIIMLKELHEAGANVSIVIDCIEHMEFLASKLCDIKSPLRIIIELDMSLSYFRNVIHLGIRRSPLRTLDALHKILHASFKYPCLNVVGVMGYEAGVAGLTDNNPFKSALMNTAARAVRYFSLRHAKKMRSSVERVFNEAGLKLEVFNGGGTGSLNLSVNDNTLTELTTGSAFFCPRFVSEFSNIKFHPALFIALQVVRSSDPNYITCGLGGGIVASGTPGPERNLQVLSPPGLKVVNTEGFGEVQTPFKVQGSIKPEIGWPVFFRPAKAGEPMEHFNLVHLIADGKVIGNAKTYRGHGWSF